MKLTKRHHTTRAFHRFELAGEHVRIRFDRWYWDDEQIVATISFGQRSFNVGGVAVYSRSTAATENSERNALRNTAGLDLPFVTAGEIDDIGQENCGDVRDLCRAVGLNPDDSAHFNEVDLAVRSASLALARKIIQRRKIPGRNRK